MLAVRWYIAVCHHPAQVRHAGGGDGGAVVVLSVGPIRVGDVCAVGGGGVWFWW